MDKKKQIIEKILTLYQNGINLHTITGLVTDTMGFVGDIKKMKGSEKKKLVIEIIILVLKNTDSGPLELFEPFIIDILPVLIDTLIRVENKKLRFNPKINRFCCF